MFPSDTDVHDARVALKPPPTALRDSVPYAMMGLVPSRLNGVRVGISSCPYVQHVRDGADLG